MEKTIENLKRLNKQNGMFWFSPDTMRFFNSKIESGIIKGEYFISSERRPDESKRRYTVRKVNWENGDIETFSDFMQFSTADTARNFIDKLR